MDNTSKLIELAKKKFRTITEADKSLFKAVTTGLLADYSNQDEKKNDPANANNWGVERVIESDRIAWLCADDKASKLVTSRGIVVKGAKFNSDLFMPYVKVRFPLEFEKCCFSGAIELHCARLKDLCLVGSHTKDIIADGITVEGSVFLREGFRSKGQVQLIGAQIKGSLDCQGAHFVKSDGKALNANDSTIMRNCFMGSGFEAHGCVSLCRAEIRGSLHCSGGNFNNPDGTAMDLSLLKCGGDIYMNNDCKVHGEVCLKSTTIAGDLLAVESEFDKCGDYSFYGEMLNVKGSIFLKSYFKGEVCLSGAIIEKNLECDKGHFVNTDGYTINADSLDIRGSVFLRDGFESKGEVDLIGVQIGGDLDCTKGQFINPDGIAIDASRLEVNGSVFLHHGFRAHGVVSIAGGRIKLNFDARCGHFKGEKGPAIIAEGVNVGGSVLLCSELFKSQQKEKAEEGLIAEGGVNLERATIGGDLNCTGSKFTNPGGVALLANRIKIGGAVVFTELEAEGAIWLVGASIGGSLECVRSQFTNNLGDKINDEEIIALIADGLKVEGDVFLCEVIAKGEVRLLGATIGGNLDSSKGQFNNEKGQALTADGVKVGGGVFLKNIMAEGEVRLRCATVGTSIECDGGQFKNESSYALIVDHVEVRGNVFLRNGFMAKSGVILQGAKIRGKLDCTTGHFNAEYREGKEEKKSYALFANNLIVEGSVFLRKGFTVQGEVSLLHAIIKGMFYWTDITSTESVKLDLRYARIGTIRDDEKSWPNKGQLFLHGLVYDQIHNVKEVPRDAKRRIGWIRRQYNDKNEEPKTEFLPQPYEHLAKILRASGDDAGATKVLIAKNKDRRRLAKLTRHNRFWLLLLDIFIAYGYRPFRAAGFGLFLLFFGCLVFGAAGRSEVMTPVRESAYVNDDTEKGCHISPDYPAFSAVLYSLDVFIPLVDLHQRSYWQPNANKNGWFSLSEKRGFPVKGSFVRAWLIIETLAGWVVVTLLIFSVTRIVRT